MARIKAADCAPAAAGYMFEVLGGGFLCHFPHMRSEAKHHWLHSSAHGKVDRLFASFVKELAKRQGGKTPTTPLCGGEGQPMPSRGYARRQKGGGATGGGAGAGGSGGGGGGRRRAQRQQRRWRRNEEGTKARARGKSERRKTNAELPRRRSIFEPENQLGVDKYEFEYRYVCGVVRSAVWVHARLRRIYSSQYIRIFFVWFGFTYFV